MAGKWAKFRGRLERFKLEDSYQTKVNEVKREYGENPEGANRAFLAAELSVITKHKKELEDKVSHDNLFIEALSQMLVENLEAETEQKVELADGTLIYMQDTPYPSVENREHVMNWIEEKRLQKLLTLNYQTLRGIVSDRLMNGEAPPPGVRVFLKTSIRVRRPGEKEEE